MVAFQEEIAADARAQDAAVSGRKGGPGWLSRTWPSASATAADAKLVIINADDLGSCHSANVGVYECLATGTVTSATLMVPCPWAREASSRYRGEDIGVHLTVNAEYELYRWGPITHAPSLLGGDGGFPRTVEDVWDHADLDEVRRECRAQIERAILWGFDVSHLDAHMGTLQLRPGVLRRLPRAGPRVRAAAAHGEPGHGALRRLPGPRRRGRARVRSSPTTSASCPAWAHARSSRRTSPRCAPA